MIFQTSTKLNLKLASNVVREFVVFHLGGIIQIYKLHWATPLKPDVLKQSDSATGWIHLQASSRWPCIMLWYFEPSNKRSGTYRGKCFCCKDKKFPFSVSLYQLGKFSAYLYCMPAFLDPRFQHFGWLRALRPEPSSWARTSILCFHVCLYSL